LWRKSFEVVLSFRGHVDRRRFLEYVVAVFVKPIEEETEELLSVVLVRTSELGSNSADRFSERDGREVDVLLSPQRSDEFPNSIGECSSCTERVVLVDVLSVSSI
jgi:hypothetical protein